MIKFTIPVSIIFLFSIVFTNCNKKDIPPSTPGVPILVPVITSFQITDICSRKVTIIGRNFEPDVSKDSIFFGEVKGIIDSVTPTEIIAEFPNYTGPVNIIVYCNGRFAKSTQTFKVPIPKITSFSPSVSGPGSIITITGENFNNDILLNTVYIDTVKVEIISATDIEIKIRVPRNATTGIINVYNRCQPATASTPFTFSNKGVVFASSNAGICHAIDIASGTTIWTAATNSRFFCGPIYDNGTIYIGSSDVTDNANNYMYALNATNGNVIWKYKAGPYDGVPVIHQGVLYVGGGIDAKLMALNAVTGEQLWEFGDNSYFRTVAPTYYGKKIYIRSSDGYFNCVNAENGQLIWRNWIWPGGNPAAVNGIVYTAATNVLYALNANDGTTKWLVKIAYLIDSSPTIVDGVLYIAAENHQIYAIDARTGNIIWQIEASWWVASAVIVEDNILYVHSGDGVIGAVNATNGTILWAKALPPSYTSGASPVVANGILFVGDNSGNLNALNSLTGEKIWTKNLGPYSMISSPCVVDPNGKVYFAGDSGNKQ